MLHILFFVLTPFFFLSMITMISHLHLTEIENHAQKFQQVVASEISYIKTETYKYHNVYHKEIGYIKMEIEQLRKESNQAFFVIGLVVTIVWLMMWKNNQLHRIEIQRIRDGRTRHEFPSKRARVN
jgi:hypothetical protein